MPSTAKITLQYFFIQLAWLSITWYIIEYIDLLPEFIPYTPIKISGVLFTAVSITIPIFLQKDLLKIKPDLTVWQLTFYSGAVSFVVEIFFQAIRQLMLTEDRIYYFLVAVIFMTLFNSIVSFLVAFQLKTKRTERLISFIVIIMVLLAILIKIFPNLEKP